MAFSYQYTEQNDRQTETRTQLVECERQHWQAVLREARCVALDDADGAGAAQDDQARLAKERDALAAKL